MKFSKAVFSVLALVFVFAGQALATYELLGDSDGLSYGWEGTRASRFLPETLGEYQFDYGDEASVTFPLPWPLDFEGTTYPAGTNFVASADGSIQIGSGGPVVNAWNADLSSHFQGGIFVQRKSNPERVVVEWQTETFEDISMGKLNSFEVVLHPSGIIRVNYKEFSSSTTEDQGSGLTAPGVSLSLTAKSQTGSVTGLPQTSHLFINDPNVDGDNDQLSNFEEYLAGTDPGKQDTDGDELLDGEDPGPLSPAQGVPGVSVVGLLLMGLLAGLGIRRFTPVND